MLTIYVTEGIQSRCLRNCEISKSAVVIDESYVNILFMQQTVKEYSSDSLPGGSALKGYLLLLSSIWKGRDFTWWSVWKGKEIYHFGRLKGPKGRDYAFCGYDESGEYVLFL